MELYNLNDFKLGWIIGDFIPSIIKTKNFEIAIKHYKVGQNETKHYHKMSDEITVIISGDVKMNGLVYHANDILYIKHEKSTDFIPLTDVITCVIKIPSVIGDKYQNI